MKNQTTSDVGSGLTWAGPLSNSGLESGQPFTTFKMLLGQSSHNLVEIRSIQPLNSGCNQASWMCLSFTE